EQPVHALEVTAHDLGPRDVREGKADAAAVADLATQREALLEVAARRDGLAARGGHPAEVVHGDGHTALVVALALVAERLARERDRRRELAQLERDPAEVGERVRETFLVVQLLRDRHALLEVNACRAVIALVVRDRGEAVERARTELRRDRVRRRTQQTLETLTPAPHVAARDPEPPDRVRDAQADLDFAGLLRPAERRAQVCALRIEPVEPAALLRSRERAPRFFREG